MSGHRKFRDLTKKFTPEEWRKVEEIQAEMRDALKIESDKKEKNLARN